MVCGHSCDQVTFDQVQLFSCKSRQERLGLSRHSKEQTIVRSGLSHFHPHLLLLKKPTIKLYHPSDANTNRHDGRRCSFVWRTCWQIGAGSIWDLLMTSSLNNNTDSNHRRRSTECIVDVVIATVMTSSGTSRADAAQIIPSQSDRTAQAFAVLCGDRSFINEDSVNSIPMRVWLHASLARRTGVSSDS